MGGRDQDVKIIVVKRRKKGGHGHHGGSWKVAYADFVTAMMAFFLVMWIVGLDSNVKNYVEAYFSNPVGFRREMGSGAGTIGRNMGGRNSGVDPDRLMEMARSYQQSRFEEAAARIRQRLENLDALNASKAQVEVVVVDEGLRIEIVESAEGEVFFPFGSAEIKPMMEAILLQVSPELARLPNPIVVEGHTDAAPYVSRGGYSNWELSVDRANAARRVLATTHLEASRFVEVRGYADKRLRLPDLPRAASNRRISILLPFTAAEPWGSTVAGAATATSAETAGSPSEEVPGP